MATYKVTNADAPIESDYWIDYPIKDPATNLDSVDEEGHILVERHVTRSVNLASYNSILAKMPAVDANTTGLADLKTYAETNVQALNTALDGANTSITSVTKTATDTATTVSNIQKKLDTIQGIDIDEFKLVTDTNIRTNAAAISTIKADIATNNANAVHITGNESISGVKTFNNTPIVPDVCVCGAIYNRTDDSHLRLKNGTGETGAYAALYGANHAAYPGCFDISARTSSGTIAKLVGKPNGSLTWNNQNIVRSVNGVSAGENGNINVIVPDATTEVKGIVQLCDDIEQNTTNRTMAVTPHAVAVYVSAGGRKANDIGIVGRQGFGVSFPDATEDELAAIGMTPMNGTYDKTSDNYGNFMSNNGGVFVYIPHYYVRYGDQTEADYDVYGANVLGVKSHDAYNSEAEANADGYFSPRAFYDGSDNVNQQGFFMQKYEPNGKTLDGVIYPFGDGSARGMVNIIPPDMMTRARNLGSDYFVASYFMHQAMDTITLLQGQHSTGTANCAWWKSRSGANYPNNGWSTTNPQLYSHNGQKNGIMGVSNFTWEFCPGVTTSGTSATQGQTTVTNNKIYLLKPTVKMKDLTNGFDGATDAWGTTANLLENYDEFDTTDHFVLTSSRTWYWGNGNNQMYISPVKNGVLDTKARDSFMLIPNSEQSVSASANTMMGACLNYTSPCTQNLALHVHGQNVTQGGKENVFSRLFNFWRTDSTTSFSFRCGAYLRD